MTSKYDLGVIVGRFQIIHKGHAQIINRALELCNTVAIFVGSSQESGTMKNPFTYEMRKEMILAAFPDVKVFPLPDIGVGNCRAWGDYVLDNVVKACGKAPDIFISGREERRIDWFGEDTAEVYVPKDIDISATKMKEFIIDGDKASFEKYIDPSLINRFDEMREILISCKDNLDTKSI